jgi:hypothetical protein
VSARGMSRHFLATTVILALAGYAASGLAQTAPTRDPAAYAWADSCRKCHEPIYNAWAKTKAFHRPRSSQRRRPGEGVHRLPRDRSEEPRRRGQDRGQPRRAVRGVPRRRGPPTWPTRPSRPASRKCPRPASAKSVIQTRGRISAASSTARWQGSRIVVS